MAWPPPLSLPILPIRQACMAHTPSHPPFLSEHPVALRRVLQLPRSERQANPSPHPLRILPHLARSLAASQPASVSRTPSAAEATSRPSPAGGLTASFTAIVKLPGSISVPSPICALDTASGVAASPTSRVIPRWRSLQYCLDETDDPVCGPARNTDE
ncbi:hypothetical protein PMIN02_000058 [Paraphaeosphaeria minitans]